MTNAQTEARAIVANMNVAFRTAKQYDAAVDILATALAAKDAELAEAKRECGAWKEIAERHVMLADRRELERRSAEAQLTEANKALDAIIERSNNDPLGTSKVNDMREIARRAREQGGE